MSLYDRIFKPHVYTLADGTAVEEKRSRAPLILLVLIALTVLSVRITGFDLAVLVKKGSKFFDILKAMFPPNTAYLGKIWQPLWDTIKMSILGSFIGAVLAVPFAVAAASNIVTNRVVVFLVRLFLSLVRTLPTLVCALIATYIFGLGTMAGTCAIAVFTFAYVGKQLFEIIETVDMGPYEAMEALGATRRRAFTTAVFPQVLPTYLSVSLFCLEGNVRYASILGYVGAGGLGLIMNEKIGWREYDSLGMILIVLFVTVMVIEGISHALRLLPSLGEAPPYARQRRRALPAGGDLLHRLPRHDRGRGDLAAPVLPVGEQSGAAGRGAGRPRAHRRHPHHPRLRLRTDVHSRHRPRTVRGTADHVPLLDWHGVENVLREHRGP